jgi:hypothetical protein
MGQVEYPKFSLLLNRSSSTYNLLTLNFEPGTDQFRKIISGQHPKGDEDHADKVQG